MSAPWRTSSRSAGGPKASCVQVSPATRVNLRGADLSGVRTYLDGHRLLSAELARLVAAHNGVSPMLDQDDPFHEVVKTLPASSGGAVATGPLAHGTKTFLDHDPTQMLRPGGLRIPLPPTFDGLPQSVTVFLHATAERAGSVFARERVDATYEFHYSATTPAQTRSEVRTVAVPRGLGLAVAPSTTKSAGHRPQWFGKPADNDVAVPRWGVPTLPASPPVSGYASQSSGARPPAWVPRPLEADLVERVQKTHPTATRETIVAAWNKLKRIRGEVALPLSFPGRADAVAQALSISSEEWDDIPSEEWHPGEAWNDVFRLPGRGREELERFPEPVKDDDLQSTGASSSGQTLVNTPPVKPRRIRWADHEGRELENVLGSPAGTQKPPTTRAVQEPLEAQQATPTPETPAATKEPAAQEPQVTTPETPAETLPDPMPVIDLLATTTAQVVGDRVVGVWLPGADRAAPALSEEMIKRLAPPPNSVFVFGSVQDGRLMAGDRQIPVATLAEVLKQRAGGLAPVLWMPQADQPAKELAEALQAPVVATPYDLRFDPDGGTLTSIGPAHEAEAEDRSPDWFRAYLPGGEPSLAAQAELKVFDEPLWPEPGATPPPVDQVLDIDPAIRSIGIPRAGLPNLPELIDKLREQIPAGVTVPQSDWNLLPQRLLSNYSHTLQDPLRPGTRGLQVPLGPVEALIMLDPVDPKRVGHPPGSTMAPATLPPAPDDDGFKSFQSINGTFATGAHSQTQTATMGATRASVSASFGVAVAPGVTARAGFSISGTANQSNRSNTNILDAEFGRVEVNNSGSVLVNYTPNWSFKLRTDADARWRDLKTVEVPDPGLEKLLLWVPRTYLQKPPSEQVTATGDAVKRTELPSNFFASGLTAIPQLFDEIAASLRDQGVSLPIGGSTRNELLQKLSNLDLHLNRAVSDKERGYWFRLNNEHGRPIATIEVHAERVLNGNRRVGATNDQTGLEDVRTAIQGTSGNNELLHNSSLSVSGSVDVDAAHLSVGAYVSATGTNADSTSGGRTGLWVMVPRYTGYTTGYYSKFVFSATVKVRDGNAEAPPARTAAMPGQALLRLTEPEAFEYGFPVDKVALKKDPGDRTEVPFERDAIRQTGRRDGDPDTKPLPAHMALGKGIGTGLVTLRPETAQRIIDALTPILREKQFLPPEGNEYADRHWYSHGNDLDSQLDNELLLEKIHGFSSFYDEMHQDGVPLVLRRRRGFSGIDWDIDTAKILVKAKQNEQNAPRYIRTSDQFDTVNLAMGMDSGGQGSSGSRKVALGFSFKGFFQWLKGGLTNVELQRTVGASDTVNYLNNRPELLAWAGAVDEWELTSDYEITVQFQHSGWQGDVRPGVRDPQPITLAGETARAYVLPLNDGSEDGPISRFPTSPNALKQAVIYFADLSGMRDAVTNVLKELTGPQGAGDQDLDTVAGIVGGRAHLKEMLNREFTTDLLSDPGFFRNLRAALNLTGAMDKTKYVGSTTDPFVTGIIKLWLAQAGTSSTTSWGITWQTLNATFGGAAGEANLSGAADVSRRWQRNRSVNDTRTGGTELIQLDFNRVYAYATTIDLAIRGVLEKDAKLLPRTTEVRDEELKDRLMIFLLPEPEALAQYATTGLPVSNARLTDALSRWRQGARPDGTAVEPLTLSGDVVAKILMRWATEVPQLPEALGIDRDELVRTLAELHETGGLPIVDADTREEFNRQFGTSLQDRANPLSKMEMPEYLTREDPGGRALGHHGVQDLKFDNGETTVKLVERKVNEVAPGLLTRSPEVWNGRGRMIGKMQGDIDSLQAILARGRDEAMLEDVLHPEGMKFYLVNPVGWLLSDVVEIKLSAVLTSPPDVKQFRPKAGSENYGHGYISKSSTRSREGGTTVNYGRFTVGSPDAGKDDPAPPPSGSGAGDARTGESHSRRTTRSEQATSEQTVYDFTGHYRTEFDIELTASARRLDMSRRPVNNALMHWFDHWTKHGAQATETLKGKLDLQIPRSIAEMGPQRGPAPLRDFTPLPDLPHNAYILGTLYGDAYGIAREMANKIFGRKHDDGSVAHLKSLPTRLLPTHIRNHLWEATVGGGYTLAEGIFMPGKSSHQATMELRGALYDMQVIGVIKEGTGTGMYIKHQSGTTASSTTGHWRSALDLSGTAGETLHPHLPPHTVSETDSNTRATASGQGSGGTENYRRELHVKELGPVLMVRMRGQFRIEADEFHEPFFGKPTQGAHFRSDPITGDAYALLDQAQVAELQAHLAEQTRQARAKAAAWPSLDGAPAFDVGRILIDAARKKFDPIRMYQEVARQIRAQTGGDRPLVLRLDQAALGAEVLRSVLRWADRALSEYRDEIGGADQAGNALERLIRTYRDLPPNAVDNALIALTNAVNGLRPRQGPRLAPREVPTLSLDPATLMRDVAHELQAHVRLDVTRPDGTTYRRWADSDGRVYVFDPLTFDDTTLSADLAQSVGLLSDTLRRDVDALGINAFDLGRLYRTSWLRQQPFEQALRTEINQRRATLEALDPRLPDLFDRTFDIAQRAADDIRALEERQRDVIRRISDIGRRLEEIDGELLRLRTDLDFQGEPQDADAVRAIQGLEAERAEHERELAALSSRDLAFDDWLWSAREHDRESWRALDDLREVARRPVDAERFDAVRRRVRSLLPAGERADATRARQVRRQLLRALDTTDTEEHRRWAERATDAAHVRLDELEARITRTRQSAPAPLSAQDLMGEAYRWWPVGTSAEMLDWLEGALRDAGHGSLALVVVDASSQRFIAANRNGEIRWVESASGRNLAPDANIAAGAFLALGPTGTLLDPPSDMNPLDADDAVFHRLHASSHAAIRSQPGAIRSAERTADLPPETSEAPAQVDAPANAPAAAPPVAGPVAVDRPLPDDPWLHTDGTAYRIGPPEISEGRWRPVGALADYAPIHWLTHGAPRSGTTLERIANTDANGAAAFLFAARTSAFADAVRHVFRHAPDRGLEEPDRLPPNLPADTWIWFNGRDRAVAAVVQPDGEYRVYMPTTHTTLTGPTLAEQIGETTRRFIIARPVRAESPDDPHTPEPTGRTLPDFMEAYAPIHRLQTAGVPGTSAATPAAPAATPEADETEPSTQAAPPPEQRFDPSRTTRGRTGIGSAAIVSGAEATDLLADAVESGSLDGIVERLVELSPGRSAGEVHESLAGLDLGGTAEEIGNFLAAWRGDFDIRVLALLESVSRSEHRRSLLDVVPGLPGLWLGRQVENFASGGLASRAVEIIDQVRNRPAALSSIVLSQARRQIGLILDLGIRFPDAATLADDVWQLVRRGELGPAARLLHGIEHDTLSILALADVYFTRFRQDIFVDVPALADAVRSVAAGGGVDSESGYDLTQLERALAGVPEGRDIDFRIAMEPARLGAASPSGSGERPSPLRHGRAWVEVRLPVGDADMGRSAYGRVFSVGAGHSGEAEEGRPAPQVVRSPDTSTVATAAARRFVSASRLRLGVDYIRTVATTPDLLGNGNHLTFANELHETVVGGRPFRGLASVALVPARRDRLPAPAFPPPESLGAPEATATVVFPENHSSVDRTAQSAIFDFVNDYVRRFVSDSRAGLPAPPVRITTFAGRPGLPRSMSLPTRRGNAVRTAFLGALEDRLRVLFPLRATQIARSEIPIDIRVLPRTDTTSRQATIETFAPRADVRPVEPLPTRDLLRDLGRAAGVLRGHGTTVPTQPASSSPVAPAAPPAPSAGGAGHTPTADDPRPPWFLQHGALGDGFVRRVDTGVDPSVHNWISEVTAGMKPAAAAAVRRRILALLAKNDAKTWEKLLRSGTLIRRRGVRVKLTFSVEDTQYAPPGTASAEEGLQTFFSKYGDTSYSEGSSKHQRRALSGRLEPLLFVIEGALSHLSPSIKISSENEFGKGRSIAMEVQSGNRVIANATHDHVGRIRVRATVDRKARPDLLLPGSARLAFPTAYSSAAEALGPPGEDGAHPTVQVTNPEVLQGLDHAVNAVSPTALTAGLRTKLEALGLPRGVVDDLVQEVTEEFFNEKTLKDRSQWWLTDSWVSSVFTGKRPVHSDFHGHLEVSGTPRTVRYVTTTDSEVLLRNDIADTAIIRDGGEHHNAAALAPALAGGVEVGDHLTTPGVELPILRSASGQSHTVLTEGQAKNAIMRKDRLVRYVTEFTMTVTLRSATHGDHEFTVPLLGELGIGRTHAAYFEHLALGEATGSGLRPPQDVPGPIAQSLTAPKLPAQERATRVQRLVQWLKSRFEPERMPLPFTAAGVRGVDDLLKLADRGPIEIAVPPELHLDGVPIGPLGLEPWDMLRGYPNVVWVYMYPETSAVVSRAEGFGGPAPWRYVLDTDAQVVGALFLPPGTTRHPTGYVPNPAVPPVTEPAPRRTPPNTWYDVPLRGAGLDTIADYLRAGGTPQIQLTDAVQQRTAGAPETDALRTAVRVLKDNPEVLVVAADGNRLSTEDREGRRAPEARFVINGDGGVRGPLPVWHHEVHPAEPIELAARKGLGPGMLREAPGLERLLREAQNALEHQMRSAGVHDRLSATDRQHLARVLAMKFGVPGMRGEFPGLMAGGVSHEVTVGGYVFTVAADGRLRALRRPPVDEGGVSLDAQHKGVSSVTAAEQTGIAVGAAVSGRFRAKLARIFSLDLHTVDVGGKRAWTRKIINSTGVKEYRRARTNGDVTRFEYDTAYTLTVTTRRPAGPVEAAQVRDLSGADYWAAVTVSNALLPETPVPPDDVVAFGQVTVLEDTTGDRAGIKAGRGFRGWYQAKLSKLLHVDLDTVGEKRGWVARKIIKAAGIRTYVRTRAHDERYRSKYGEEAAIERPSDITRWPLANLGDEFDLNAKGLSGMQVRLTGTEEVARHLGEMVAAHNDAPWLSAKGDAFREILAQIVPTGSRYGVAERIIRTGTPTYLEANARRMLKKGRLRVQLPATADGWEQEVTIWLRTFGASHEKPVTGATQEQYTEADLRFGEEDAVTDSGDISGGVGTVFRIGAPPPTEGEHTTSQKASSQVSFGATGGRSGSRQRYSSTMGGGLDLNLGTYSGTSHSYGANAVYEIVHRRWRGKETRSAKRAIGVRRGVALLAPQTRAIDHGLPLPPDTELPATDHPVRHPVDRELVMAVAYRENADTAEVLPAIEEMLGGVDPEVLRAVRAAFDEEAMRAEYPIARSGGIHQIVTSPAKFWRSRRLMEYFKIPAELGGVVRTGIRVVMEEEWEQHDRPRPDVRVTVGGQAFTQKISGKGRSRTTHGAAYVHGRWAGSGEGARAAGGGHVDYESGQSSKSGNTTTIRDIRRATAKDGSQEFATGARWRIEIYQHISPNELVHQAGRLVTAVPNLVDVLSRGESKRLWQQYFPPDRAPLGTRQVEVKAAALVPDHLTTAEATVPVPPGKAKVTVSRTPAPEPSPLARILARYVHALATPGSWQVSPSAPLAAVPWRGVDFAAVSRGVAPYLADFAIDGQDRFTVEVALNERNLLANIADLLNGTYRIPLLDGTSLVVQLVPRNGRWLTRGGWTGLNFPEDSTEPERETEVRHGWSHGFDFEFGHPVGKPLSEGVERPLLDGGPANDRGPESVHSVKKNSTGDYVESNIQRDGDYDFYRFDAEFVITGPHGHTVSAEIANGFIGMVRSAVLNRIGSVDGLGPAGPTPTVDRPYDRGRAGRPDAIENWPSESRVNGNRRSPALRDLDAAVETVRGDRDDAEALQAVLYAIDEWRTTKAGPSIRDAAVRRLQAAVDGELARLQEAGTIASSGAGPATAGGSRPAGPAATASTGLPDLSELEHKYFPPGLDLGTPHQADTVVTPHVDGAAFFGAIADVLDTLGRPGDRLYITSWYLHLDTRLRHRKGEPTLGERLVSLAAAGVDVRVIVAVPRYSISPFEKPLPADFWRRPLAAGLGQYAMTNLTSVRRLREAHVGDRSVLDGRVLIDWGGGLDSRHEKSTIAYRAATQEMHAFVGGMDYAPNRFAGEGHGGAPNFNYWHDAGVQLEAGAADEVIGNFWTRWDETATLPQRDYWFNRVKQPFNPAVAPKPGQPVPPRAPGAADSPAGSHTDAGVRIWRSYAPDRVAPLSDGLRLPWQTLPPGGVTEISDGLTAAIDAAERYIYVEDQTINPSMIARAYNHHAIMFPAVARALSRGVKVLFVTQGFAGRGSPAADATPNVSSEINALILNELTPAQRQNLAVFSLRDTKIHSKLVLIDDEFASVGSANFWDRSMAGDESEVNAAIVHPGGPDSLVADLRVQLWREHLRLPQDPTTDAALRDLDVGLGYFRGTWGTGAAADIPDSMLEETGPVGPAGRLEEMATAATRALRPGSRGGPAEPVAPQEPATQPRERARARLERNPAAEASGSPFSPLPAEQPDGNPFMSTMEGSAPDSLLRLLSSAPRHTRTHTWFDPASPEPVTSAFDVRRVVYGDDRVTELTVIVDLHPDPRVGDEDVQDTWRRVSAGVEEYFNRPGRRFPHGHLANDILRVNVVPPEPGRVAHLTVTLAPYTPGEHLHQDTWVVGQRPVFYAHEIAHALGARDESRQTSRNYRLGNTIHTIKRTASNAGSLMGNFDAAPERGPDGEQLSQGGLRPRHLDLFATLIGDVTPFRYRVESGEAPPPYPNAPEYDPGPTLPYTDEDVLPETAQPTATRLRLSVEDAARLLRYSWFDVGRFQRLAGQVGETNPLNLARWVERIGRIPDDLSAIADQFPSMRESDVYDVSRWFHVDPRHLLLFAEELNGVYDRVDEPGFDAFQEVWDAFEERYGVAGTFADFVTVAVRAQITPEELRRVLRAHEGDEEEEREDLTPAAMAAMGLEDLRDLVDSTLRIHTGPAEPDSIEAQADRILHHQMLGELTEAQSGKISNAWFADASAQLQVILGRTGARSTDRLHWAANRARRLVDLRRNGVHDLPSHGLHQSGQPTAGSSTGQGTAAAERPDTTQADLDDIAARLAPMQAEDVEWVSEYFGIDPRDLPLFGDALPAIYRRTEVDPAEAVQQLFDGYSPDIAPFVSVATRAGIDADEMHAVISSARDNEGLTIGDLYRMPIPHLRHLVNHELAPLRRLVGSLAPMTLADVSRVTRTFGITPDSLRIFGDDLLSIYARRRDDADPLEDVRHLFDDYASDDIAAFTTIARRIGDVTAGELEAVLIRLTVGGNTTLNEVLETAPDDLHSDAHEVLSALEEMARQLAPLTIRDVAELSVELTLEVPQLRVFADQIRPVSDQPEEMEFDLLDAVNRISSFVDQLPVYRGETATIARLASEAELTAGELSVTLASFPAPGHALLPSMDNGLAGVMRTRFDQLRRAAEQLAPMSISDVADVTGTFMISPTYLAPFGSRLPEIYTQAHARGLNPRAAVRRLFARYTDRPEDLDRFASVATRAGVSAEAMRLFLAVRQRPATRPVLDDLRAMPANRLVRLVNATIGPLRTAAGRLAPMTMADVFRVTREFAIETTDLWVFGTALSDIYAGRGTADPIPQVREMLARYADLNQIGAFASAASEAGITADAMRAATDQAQRDQEMDLTGTQVSTSQNKRRAPDEEGTQQEANEPPSKRPRTDEVPATEGPAQAGPSTSTARPSSLPAAFEQRIEQARRTLRGLPARQRRDLLVQAGQINGHHHMPPRPIGTDADLQRQRLIAQGAALIVAAQLHADAGTENQIARAHDVSRALADQLGTRRRIGGAPPAGSRPPIDPYEIGGAGGPSGTSHDDEAVATILSDRPAPDTHGGDRRAPRLTEAQGDTASDGSPGRAAVRAPADGEVRAAGNGGLATTVASMPATGRATPMAFFDAPRSAPQQENDRPAPVPPAPSPDVPVVGSPERPVTPATVTETGPPEVAPPADTEWHRSPYSRPLVPGGAVFCVEVAVVETGYRTER